MNRRQLFKAIGATAVAAVLAPLMPKESWADGVLRDIDKLAAEFRRDIDRVIYMKTATPDWMDADGYILPWPDDTGYKATFKWFVNFEDSTVLRNVVDI